MKVGKKTVIMTHDEIRLMLKIYSAFSQAAVAILGAAEMVDEWSDVLQKLNEGLDEQLAKKINRTNKRRRRLTNNR